MNQLATLGLVFNIVPKNVLTLTAGDATTGMSTVYQGTIFAAYGDYSSQPDVPFIFECIASGAEAVGLTAPSSFPGTSDVATIMAGLARQMNLTFENNNVSVKLQNVYLAGSIKSQIDQLANMAGISCGIINQTLAIWPKGGNRTATGNIPVISAPPGTMIGYPAFTQQGIIVKTLFNPQITFGSLIKIESSLLAGIAQAQQGKSTNSNSTFPSQWAINKIDHSLDSLVPKGDWMSTIYAYNPGYAKGIIPPGSG